MSRPFPSEKFLLWDSSHIIPFLYHPIPFHPSINPSIYHSIPTPPKEARSYSRYSELPIQHCPQLNFVTSPCGKVSVLASPTTYHRAKAALHICMCTPIGVHFTLQQDWQSGASCWASILPLPGQGPATKWSKAWQVPLAEEALRTEFWRMHDWQTADTYVALSVYTQTLQRCTDSVFALGR